ncbi:MAG: hypothetical protein NW201_10410 [Gemmatimonadales bacterium]|nr:hypothetical protein [Gemmatimonadales bacterium]
MLSATTVAPPARVTILTEARMRRCPLRALTVCALLLAAACASGTNESAATRPAVSPLAAGRIVQAVLTPLSPRPDGGVSLTLDLALDGLAFERREDLAVDVTVPGRATGAVALRACRATAQDASIRDCRRILFDVDRPADLSAVVRDLRPRGVIAGPLTWDSLQAGALPLGARSDADVIAVLRQHPLVRNPRADESPGFWLGGSVEYRYIGYFDRRADAVDATPFTQLVDGDTLIVTARELDGSTRSFRLPYLPSTPRGVNVAPPWDW